MNGRVSYLLIFLLAFNPSNLPAEETPFYLILGPGEFPKVNNALPESKEYVKGKIPYADWLIKRRALVRDKFVECVGEIKKVDLLERDRAQTELNWIFVKSKKKLDYIKFLEEKFLKITGITMEQAGYDYGMASLKEEISILEKTESEQKSRGSNGKAREKTLSTSALDKKASASAPAKKYEAKKAAIKVVEVKSDVTPEPINETINTAIGMDETPQPVEIDRSKVSDSLKKEGLAEKVSSAISRLKSYLIERLASFKGKSNEDKNNLRVEAESPASTEKKSESSIKQAINPVKNTVSVNSDAISSLKEEKEKLKSELAMVEDQKKKKDSELAKANAILEKAQNSNRACREKNEKISKSVKKLEKELTLKEEKIGTLSKQLVNLEKELNKNKEEPNLKEDSNTEVDLIVPPTAPVIGTISQEKEPEKKTSMPEYKSFYDEEIKLSNERINKKKNELKKGDKKETVSELANKNDKEEKVSLKEKFMNEISGKVEKEKNLDSENNSLDKKQEKEVTIAPDPKKGVVPETSSESETRSKEKVTDKTIEEKKEETDKKDEKESASGPSLEKDKKKETLVKELSEKLSVENTDNMDETAEVSASSIKTKKENSNQKEKEKPVSYSAGEASELEGRISGLKEDISQKESKIKELSEKLEELAKSNNGLDVKKERIKSEIEELNSLILKKKEEVSGLSKKDEIAELAPKLEKAAEELAEEQETAESKEELQSSVVSKLKESLASEFKEQELEGTEAQENEESSVETKKDLTADKSSGKSAKTAGLIEQLGEVDERRRGPVMTDSDEKATKLRIKESAKQNDSEERKNPRILEEGLIEEANGPTF